MKLRTIIIILGLAFMLGNSLIMTHTFMTAYSTPSKSVLVLINEYGEATIELIIFLLSIPFILIATYLITKSEARRWQLEV